ncbi:MAG: enoyl-CoA hydratase/isomerase family protein [Burkholderiaceae bacterium]
MTDEILFDVADGIGHVTLNRPQARNAITFEMYDRLAQLCHSLGGRDDLRALIISGAGDKAFAAGTDISRFRDFRTGEDALRYERRIDEVLAALEQVPVPTIAAIRGACTGGGAAIAIACDLRIGASDMRFGFPIARTLGNCLSAASLARVVSVLGAERTRQMLFTARLIDAEQALASHLLLEIAEEPLERARSLARELGAMAPLTLRAIKEGLRRLRIDGPAAQDEDLIRLCYESADFREGMSAFFEKRPPQWRGR